MTFKEAYTSLLKLYKDLMFPPPSHVLGGQVNRTGWTMSQVDEMDVHFFNELFGEEFNSQQEEVYLSDIW
ncbi:hypothetical protein [Virgibacillus salexigens]|uniref:hypothetical protein n=1 Tax=Virgibacillus TaxID=84406 RepID=UPI001369A2DF|nr:hypothetical protein [Virgibacillus massiliensis]MYL41827.1 hypothetical protein [Virgibacillus massiliensis]